MYIVHKGCFTKTLFQQQKNGGTHQSSAWGLVWREPKQFLISTKFRGSSGHLKFDKNQPEENLSLRPLRSTHLLLTLLNWLHVPSQQYPQCYLSEFRPTTWPRLCLCPMLCPQKGTWYLCLTWFPLTFFPTSNSPQKRTFCNFCMAKAPNPGRSKTEEQGALRKAAVKKK